MSRPHSASPRPLTPQDLQHLACPACHGSLAQESTQQERTIRCLECGRRYPVVDGLPVLLMERAQ